MNPIRMAVIPGDGFGTRFLPFTKAVPKGLVSVVGKPFIPCVPEEAEAPGIAGATPEFALAMPEIHDVPAVWHGGFGS